MNAPIKVTCFRCQRCIDDSPGINAESPELKIVPEAECCFWAHKELILTDRVIEGIQGLIGKHKMNRYVFRTPEKYHNYEFPEEEGK